MPSPHTHVAGLELPTQLAGHPVLEFCNTFAGWNGEPRRDYLESFEHLARWSGYAGLVRPERAERLVGQAAARPRAAKAALKRAAALRADLYDVLTAGPSASPLTPVAEAVEAAAREVRLCRGPSGLELEIADDAGLATPLHSVAWSAGQLLTSPDAAFVRACPGSGCGWLFLDRGGRRRWCTMAVCGNRDKVRRFAARQRQDDRPAH